MYNDTGLTPNTYYSYRLESYNVIDSTTSSEVVFQTLEGVPTGISAPTYTVLNATSVAVMWTEPTVAHGTISHYVLLLSDDGAYEEVFRGNAFTYIVTNLRPYTVYSFIIQACTTGGCGRSPSSQVRTAQAPPTSQPAPDVTALGDTELLIQWEAPAEPNGVILEYRIFQRGTPFEGDGEQIATVNETTQSYVVDELEPFTRYQFRVESYTEAGGTSSAWSDGTTGEAGTHNFVSVCSVTTITIDSSPTAPSGVYAPEVQALSSSSIQVTWREPATPNGVIISYSIFNTTAEGEQDSLLMTSPFPGSLFLHGLTPFTEYGFAVEVCTAAGCTVSGVGRGFTGESGKHPLSNIHMFVCMPC